MGENSLKFKTCAQSRPYADASDAAALGPAPWCLGRLFICAWYSLRWRIQ